MHEELRVCRDHAWRVVLMILCVAVCVFFSERTRIEHEALRKEIEHFCKQRHP